MSYLGEVIITIIGLEETDEGHKLPTTRVYRCDVEDALHHAESLVNKFAEHKAVVHTEFLKAE